MAASGAYVNSSGWAYTPNGGAGASLPKVKEWSLPRGISRIRESADFDHFYTLNVCDFEDPTVSLTTLDPFSLFALDPGVFGTLVGVVRDANNGAITGGGAKQITLTNCCLSDESGSGSHRQYARGTYAFCGTSVDGATSPLSISAL
jgi:hypothetical protein